MLFVFFQIRNIMVFLGVWKLWRMRIEDCCKIWKF